MAQTNYTPIQLYSSSTASNVPLAANLAAGELAINTNDGILFYKDSGGVVQKIGYKLRPTNAGGTGLTSFTANGLVYASSTSALATGSALTFDGTTLNVGLTEYVGRIGATSGYAKTDTAERRTLSIRSTEALASNPLELYFALQGNATSANQAGVIQTGHYGSDFNAVLGINPNGGNVGIGTSSPAQTLHVKTSTSATPITLGVLSNATGLPALSFNGAYASSTMAGIYGNGATASNLYYTVPANQNHYFAIADSAKMTLDSSGNLGLGVTPSAWGSTSKALQFSTGAFEARSASFSSNTNAYFNAGWLYVGTGRATLYNQTDGQHVWYNSASGTAGNAITFTQAMTLDASGNLLVGMTSTSGQSGMSIVPVSATYTAIHHATGSASGTEYALFRYNGGGIGSITQNGTTGVLYNLTSDYRLKNDQQALTGAKDFIMALKPKKWQWWDGSGEGVGFVAHEFMEVAKHSGNGEKDAVDSDGKPVYQSIQPSSSEVMANLVAFIQEQQALITQLTARITALESA